jgi:hypothetical protein
MIKIIKTINCGSKNFIVMNRDLSDINPLKFSARIRACNYERVLIGLT